MNYFSAKLATAVALAASLIFQPMIMGFNEANASINLVTNGNFESADFSGQWPSNLGRDQWGNLNATFAYKSDAAGQHYGSISISNHQDGDAKWTYPHQKVVAGQTYIYSDTYQSDIATEVDAEVIMKDGSYQYFWLGDVPASAAWNSVVLEFTIPDNAKSATLFHLIAGNGTLNIDDMSVVLKGNEPTPTPTAVASLAEK